MYGVVIREETIIKGENYKNGMIQIVSEKERAAKNQAVFRYMANDEENLKKKIQETDLKIQEALSKQEILSTADIKNLEKQIDDKVKYINILTDVQKISEYKKDISNIVIKKAKIIGDSSKSGSYIKELTEEREQYEAELTEGSEFVNAPVAGLVSYRVDGLENTLSPSNFDELSEEKLESLNIKTGKIVPNSSEEAKIINNFNIHITAVSNSQSAIDAKVGDIATITLASGEEVKAKIVYKKEENGKNLIVFKLDNLKDELVEYRKVSFNITWWSKTGLKVPNDAIIEDENNNICVIKEKAGTYSKVYIKVLKKNDKYSIVENLKAEDFEKIGVEASKVGKISQHDMILLYPDLGKIK